MVIRLIYYMFYTTIACYAVFFLLLFIQNTPNRLMLLFFWGFSFMCHTIYIVTRGWMIGIFMPNSILSEPFFLPWLLSLMCIILSKTNRDMKYILPIIIPFIVISIFLPKGTPVPSPKQWTILSTLFFLFEVIGHAFFILGGWLSILVICKRISAYNNKKKHIIIIGFVIYSLAQIIGAYWSYLGWTIPFHWGDRHMQSAAIWCYYAAYIHFQYINNNSNLREKLEVLGAILVIFFSYYSQLKEINIPRLG